MALARCTLGLVLILTLAGCPKDEQTSDVPGPRQVKGTNSNEGILRIGFDPSSSAGFGRLSIKGIPDGAVLSCAMDKELFQPCADEVEVALPQADGEHSVTVVARVDGQVKAVGETHFETGEPSRKRRKNVVTSVSASRTYNSDLTLEIDPAALIQGSVFQDGMSIRRTEDVEFHFRFVNTPLCDPVIRCTSDRANSKFEPLCDLALGKSYRARTMPKGLQFLKVQATCGDKAGEPLTLFWYGVESNYTYMALDTSYLANRDRYIFTLMNPSDCPENLLQYECRYSSADVFSECKGADGAKNVVSNPPAGFAMRAVCNGTPYQAYEAVQD